MDSVINDYNNVVKMKCEERMRMKKIKTNRDYLAPNRVFNKELGGIVAPKKLTEKQFKNVIKNAYQYLGESIPSEPQLEDLYEKAFNTYTFEEFNEFMDMVQFGNFDNIQDAYKSFTRELSERDRALQMSIKPSQVAPIEIEEDISVTPEFFQYYPPVGAEAEYGFAPIGEITEGALQREEVLRRQAEFEAGGRPVPQQQTFTGQRGRPRDVILEDLTGGSSGA